MLRRRREPDVVDALSSVVDGLRSGLSLRQAVLRTAGTDGSPLAPTAMALDAGRPLADVLRTSAAHAVDADLRSALCVLSAHADAGGDPVPAVSALATRLRRRQAARREAGALTTQARLGARAMLLLTPGFWLLLVASSPKATLQSIQKPGARTAVVLGVVLQLLGAAWIASIVRHAAGTNRRRRLAGVPLLRVLAVVFGGRQRSSTGEEVAEAAETIAFVLDAGVAPASALERVAPLLPGAFGERVASVVASVNAGTRLVDALRAATDDLGEAAVRLARAFESSVSLGVPLAPALRSLADDVRERSAAALSEDVRTASVKVLVPLGLLILPAFVLSCLVPLFAGGLTGLSGS